MLEYICILQRRIVMKLPLKKGFVVAVAGIVLLGSHIGTANAGGMQVEPHVVLLTENENTQSYAQRILDLVNIERRKAGVKPLVLSDELMMAAAVRSQEVTKVFSHTRPDGTPFSSIVSRHGRRIGENIGGGYQTPEEVVDGWMHSEGHRKNILHPDFTELGVGYTYEENSQYKHYWVQIFRRPM